MMDDLTSNAMRNVVRRLRRRSEDVGPLAARAYLDAANEIEGELKKLDKRITGWPCKHSAHSEHCFHAGCLEDK